jgi:hypothetical protein
MSNRCSIDLDNEEIKNKEPVFSLSRNHKGQSKKSNKQINQKLKPSDNKDLIKTYNSNVKPVPSFTHEYRFDSSKIKTTAKKQCLFMRPPNFA